MALDAVLIAIALVALAWIVVRTVQSSGVDRRFDEEERGWERDRSYPREVERAYPQRRNELLDSTRMRAMGYEATEKRVESPSPTKRLIVTRWVARRPPARR